MKKYGIRLIVGLITFTIGLGFVWSDWTKNVKFCEPVRKENQLTESQQNKFSTSEAGKIEVRFKGYGKIENQPAIKFEVINHNLKSAKYSAYANNTLTFVNVKFNGKEDVRYHCGTGLKEFELNSGESIETEVVLDYLVYDFLDNNGKFEFGYYFRLSKDKEAKNYWSESITISDGMKKEILESSSRLLK
jgi:hypothetical protein